MKGMVLQGPCVSLVAMLAVYLNLTQPSGLLRDDGMRFIHAAFTRLDEYASGSPLKAYIQWG